MELEVGQDPPDYHPEIQIVPSPDIIKSFHEMHKQKKRLNNENNGTVKGEVPHDSNNTTSNIHGRKLSTESSSNGNQSMTVSPSPPSPSSSHLQSPLTATSSHSISRVPNVNLQADINSEVSNNQISRNNNNNNNNNNVQDDGETAVFANSHELFTDTQAYHEEDPLYVSHETSRLLEPPALKTFNKFHSTSSIEERRHTEPVKGLGPLRNNSLKPKILARHSTFPATSQSQEIIHFTDDINNPIADEVERLRNSILTQREAKRKRKEFLEDEKVLVGNKVSEGHSNYVMAYNMLTGIRVSVSRVSGVMKPLTDADFTLAKKLAFDVSGSELTPSSKYDFKFKDYAPTVFRELRQCFGLDPADYLVSLTSKYILSELGSPGKSGSFFYYSRDYRFIIKTIHHSEHRQLRSILREYYNYVKENPNTLISQFYGLHRLKMRVNGRHIKVHFLVMNNLFPAKKDIHKQYDLKGSTEGRYTRKSTADASKKTVVYKDLNWLEDGYNLKLNSPDKMKLVTQLRRDVALLQKLNIMDYSMLIGVHDCKFDTETQAQRLSVSHPIDNNSVTFTIPKHLLDAEDEETRGYYRCLKSNDNDYIYYIGVIDCLTRYSTLKRLETLMRRLNGSHNFSCIKSKDYGERFIRFMEDNVFKKDKNE